ncbi:hypothetical protein TYRP_018516 [Tyrophagus putrescentiae]|nr:hypothetical protein TYRP_018516 [Tyrophagus putrescentiae]
MNTQSGSFFVAVSENESESESVIVNSVGVGGHHLVGDRKAKVNDAHTVTTPGTSVSYLIISAHVYAWGWRVGTGSNGKVHANPAIVERYSIAHVLGSFSVSFVFKVDERKSTRATSVRVMDNLQVFNLSIR